jgi:hypothetical protein
MGPFETRFFFSLERVLSATTVWRYISRTLAPLLLVLRNVAISEIKPTRNQNQPTLKMRILNAELSEAK